MKAYLAAPIFTERDRNFNSYLEEEILKRCPELDLYLAQNNKSINDKTGCATSADIYVGDITRLKEADILITVMSGDLPPIGSSYEVAYYCGLCEQDPRRRIIALYDDSREANHTYSDAKRNAMISGIAENQFPYINLLAIGFVKKWGTIYRTSTELIEAVEREYKIGCDTTLCGVYKITNLKQDKFFIGASEDVYAEWKKYRTEVFDRVSEDIKELGENYFKFEVLERCEKDELSNRLEYWKNYLDARYYFYNSDDANKENAVCNYCERAVNKLFDGSESVKPVFFYNKKTRLYMGGFDCASVNPKETCNRETCPIYEVATGKRASYNDCLWAFDYYDRLPDDYFATKKFD